jgi:hypothetical protein
VHQHLFNAEETHTENNGTNDSEEEGLVLLIIRRLEELEDTMEDEQIVDGEHPFQEVACTPIESVCWAADKVDVDVEKASTSDEEERVDASPAKRYFLFAPVEDDIVEDDEEEESTEKDNPMRVIFRPDQDMVAVAVVGYSWITACETSKFEQHGAHHLGAGRV